MYVRRIKVRYENGIYIAFDSSDRRYLLIEDANTEQDLTTSLAKQLVLNEEEQLQIDYLSSNSIDADFLSAPLAAYLEISDQCKISCEHCFKLERGYSNVLTYNQLISIIDELFSMGVFELRFVGFEPTQNRHFEDLAKYAKEKDFYLVLNTSGYFNDKTKQLIADLRFNEVLVSLDGTEEIHDKIRHKGSYRSAIGVLEFLSNCGIKTRVNMTVSGKNIHCMEHIAEIACSVNAIAGYAPMRMIGLGRHSSNDSSISPKDMRIISQKVVKLRQRYPYMRVILAYHDILDSTSQLYHPIWKSDPCPAVKNISILNNGQVFLCDFLAHIGDKYCGGNVIEQTILDIWRFSKNFDDYRMITRSSRCHKCGHFGKKCNGGCASEILGISNIFFDRLCFLNHRTNPESDEISINRFEHFYDEGYFMNGITTQKSNYQNYRWIPEKIRSEIDTIIELLELTHDQVIIDYGAAFGFYVKAFREKGFNAYGVDFSPYAVKQSQKDPETADYMVCSRNIIKVGLKTIDWVIAKDVLEHLTLDDLFDFLREVKEIGADLFVMVPLAKYDGGRYIIVQSENDKGHILRRSENWWSITLQKYFSTVESIDCTVNFHPQYQEYDDGIGYFICRNTMNKCMILQPRKRCRRKKLRV